jgi:hypothetical protein
MSDGLVPRNAAQAGQTGNQTVFPDQARKLIETAYATGNRYAAL